jgi:hypothetical protein
MSDSSKKPYTIEVFKIRALLKDKLGALRINKNDDAGYIAEDKVEEADALIGEACRTSHDDIGKILDQLTLCWKEMQDFPAGGKREDKAHEIFTLSHEIKDIGSLCGYSLAAYFAESLRDYIAETNLNLKNQRIITQAHIDALTVVHKNNLKADGGPAAEELKKMVKVAIDKYH